MPEVNSSSLVETRSRNLSASQYSFQDPGLYRSGSLNSIDLVGPTEIKIISTLNPRKVKINKSVLLTFAQQRSVLSRMKNVLVETELSSQRGDNIEMVMPSMDLRGGVMDEVAEDLTVKHNDVTIAEKDHLPLTLDTSF